MMKGCLCRAAFCYQAHGAVLCATGLKKPDILQLFKEIFHGFL